MSVLKQVADGVWVRQSEWVWSNTTLVRTDDGMLLVDPGIDGAELDDLADDLERLGVPVVAGFATHPHWDHLLWHPRFGDVPRWATPTTVSTAAASRQRARAMAAESAPGVPLDLVGLLTPLPPDGAGLPGELVEHEAHATGHAALLLADHGVLVAGDMLSDALVPMLDPHRPDQLAAYETALDRLQRAAERADVVVPGHGSPAHGRAAVDARLDADLAYVEALRAGVEPDDARLQQDWLAGIHRSNQEQARHATGG